MSAGRVAAGLLAVLASGCALRPPGDPYELARSDARRGELLGALARLDRLPPSHPRAAQARTLAAEVRARMARALDLLRQGLELEGNGQVEASVELFRRAHAEWPASEAGRRLLALRTDARRGFDPGAQARTSLSAAAARRVMALSREPLPPVLGPVPPDSPETRRRALAALAQEPVPARTPGPVVALPAAPGGAAMPPAPAAGGTDAATGPAAGAPQLAPPPQSPRVSPAPPVVVIAPHVQRDLDAARAAGQLDRAAEILLRIPDRAHADPAWRRTWAALFDRRALVRYGRGDVARAAADWEDALALTPEDTVIRSRLQAASREIRR